METETNLMTIDQAISRRVEARAEAERKRLEAEAEKNRLAEAVSAGLFGLTSFQRWSFCLLTMSSVCGIL